MMPRALMHTASGGMFDLLNPRVEDVKLADIATHLSRIVRFNGAHRVSVAQHSVDVANEALHSLQHPVSWLVDEDRARFTLYALLHDAHEAYIGDITYPMKAALEAHTTGRFITAFKWEIQRVVLQAFGLSPSIPVAWSDWIHEADLRCLIRESWAAGFEVSEPGYTPEMCVLAATMDRGTAPFVWSDSRAREEFTAAVLHTYALISESRRPPALR